MRIARVFLDSDLRCSFEGLRLVMKEQKEQLGPNDLAVFLNRKASAFKIITGNDYLIYYKSGSARRIPLEAIKHLPVAFGGKEFDFTRSIRKSLCEKLRIDEPAE